MSDPEPIDHILRKMKKKWEEDKENWSVLGNVDKEGNKEMLISQAPNTYWLKMKSVSAYSNMGYGKEITNIDDEINKKIFDGKPLSKQTAQNEMLQLFGMMVPSQKDILYTGGVELHSPRLSNETKTKIEEKQSDADRIFRQYLRKKWEKEHPQRDGLYM